MGRRYIDCREMPDDKHCTVAIAADSDDELVEVAVDHAVRHHGYEDSAELRKEIRSMIKDGTPPLKAPKPSVA